MVAGGGSYGGFLAARCSAGRTRSRRWSPMPRSTTSSRRSRADYGAEKDALLRVLGEAGGIPRYSPHISAANFNTPTLVIHGQLDLRVPVNHGLELFNTLQKSGVPSKLLYFEDENHWVLKPQNSLFWYREVRTGSTSTRAGPPPRPRQECRRQTAEASGNRSRRRPS